MIGMPLLMLWHMFGYPEEFVEFEEAGRGVPKKMDFVCIMLSQTSGLILFLHGGSWTHLRGWYSMCTRYNDSIRGYFETALTIEVSVVGNATTLIQ